MFAEQLEQLIPNILGRDVDHMAKALWQGFASGALAEDEAARLAMLIEARRGIARPAASPAGSFRPLAFTPRRPQRSPDWQRSLLRRRQLAAAGPLPPHLASMFTTGEQAVLGVIASEVRSQGCCDRSLDELAARAGVSRATVQRAVRVAGFAGLIVKEERPRKGCKSLTNVIRLVSREWLDWLRKRPARPVLALVGVKPETPRTSASKGQERAQEKSPGARLANEGRTAPDGVTI